LPAGAEKKDDLEDTPQLMVYKDQIHFIHGLPYHEKRLFTGVVVSRHENGLREMYVTYKDGEKHGLETNWNRNGQKSSERTYKNGKKDGLMTRYSNGQKEWEGTYKDDKLISSGSW